MNTITPTIFKQHIASTPDVCGGKPCIAGTRIRVQDIYVWHELQGQSPDQITHEFPQLTLADVYAALSYFWDHRDAIMADIDAERRLVENMKSKNTSALQEKRRAMRNDGPSIPS
jgi:uncharacterized protein (DUF433 family)